jgi:hypothetical protein
MPRFLGHFAAERRLRRRADSPDSPGAETGLCGMMPAHNGKTGIKMHQRTRRKDKCFVYADKTFFNRQKSIDVMEKIVLKFTQLKH